MQPEVSPRPGSHSRRGGGPAEERLWPAARVPPSPPGAGPRVPTSETQTSGILERPEVGPLLLPARPLFSFLPFAVVTGTQQSPPWSPSERTRGGQGGAPGPGSLGWSRSRPLPKSATLAGPTTPRPAARAL